MQFATLRALLPLSAIMVLSAIVAGQAPARPVTFERIVNATQEPHNWLTYSGSLRGERHAPLTQITPTNVSRLELAWLWQARTTEKFEATPLVVDGVMYTVQPPNEIVALDAFSGRVLWSYTHDAGPVTMCCGRVNRGLAIAGATLFIGTLDAHVVAIDAQTGKLVWDKEVADSKDPLCGGLCYAITLAPLIVKDKVLVGVAGGDSAGGGIRGFIAALDINSGREAWRFYTIPSPGEPGSETWAGDSWKVGGAGVWSTGSFDSELNLTYWGIGNPDGDIASRTGDNLYSNSVVALDADSGRLKWSYQFTPSDEMDWDAAHVPVLVDREWKGQPRKLLLMANKNGFLYALDRASGVFLGANAFVTVNWLEGFDSNGRPRRVPGRMRRVDRATGRPSDPIYPDGGGTNFDPPSYSPATGLLYIPAWERGPNNLRFGDGGYGALRAVDPVSGERRWEFAKADAVFHGVLTTASGLLFSGTDEGCRSRAAPTSVTACGTLGRGGRRGGPNFPSDSTLLPQGSFFALDAATGRAVWQMSLGGFVYAAPITYAVNGKQYIAVAAGNTVFAFALRP